MFVLACVRQTEEDLEKERKKQRAENERVEEGGAWHWDGGLNATGTFTHASLPLCGFWPGTLTPTTHQEAVTAANLH